MAGSCARTEILVGQLGLAQLAESHVVIAGLGGVGGAWNCSVGLDLYREGIKFL